MAITTLPTRGPADLGVALTNTRAPIANELSAVNVEAAKDRIIEIATEVGLSDGSTAGSINATLTARIPSDDDPNNIASAADPGVAVKYSRGDHEHALPIQTLVTVLGANVTAPTIDFNGVTLTGVDTPVNATDVTNKAYVDAAVVGGGVPSSRTITAGTGLTGGGDLTADRTLTVDIAGTNPLPIGTAAPGSSGKVSDRDHVHAHGAQTGPTNHALATKSAHGFLDSADYDRVIGASQNQEIVFREEFEAGVPLGWTGAVTGAGATVALVVGGSTYGSLLRLYVGTTATGTAQIDRSLNHFYTNRYSQFSWSVKAFVSALSTGAEEYDLFVCYSGVNGVSFSYDRNTSLNWQTTRWAAGVPTHTATTVVADTAIHSFGWVWTSAAGGTVTLSIDGVAVGVAYTGVTFAAINLTAGRMVKSAGTVPPFAYLDFTEGVGTLATPRS